VPCKKKTTGELGLYDIVNNKFYENKGTGIFASNEDDPSRIDYNAYIYDNQHFQRVEYIEANGNQYMDTVVAANKLFKINMQFTDNSTRQLMGISPSSTAYFGNNKGAWEKVDNSNNININKRCIVNYDVNNITENRTHTWIEGSTGKFQGSSASDFETSMAKPFRLCALGTSFRCSMKIFSLKVLNAAGKTINYLVPCINLDNNSAGLYDVVEKQFYASTYGTFIAGPSIEEDHLRDIKKYVVHFYSNNS